MGLLNEGFNARICYGADIRGGGGGRSGLRVEHLFRLYYGVAEVDERGIQTDLPSPYHVINRRENGAEVRGQGSVGVLLKPGDEITVPVGNMDVTIRGTDTDRVTFNGAEIKKGQKIIAR